MGISDDGGTTDWKWVWDLGGSFAGLTDVAHDPQTGAILEAHGTELSKLAIGYHVGRNVFLHGVAHEGLHRVRPVGVDANGDVIEMHIGDDCETLKSCIQGQD